MLSASDYLDPIPVRRRKATERNTKREMERGERGGWRRRRRNELFVIPTKGKSLFTFVISIELIRGIPLVAVESDPKGDESKFGISTKEVISRWKGRKGRRYSLEFAFGLRNLHERETRRVWPRRAAVVSGPSLLLFHVQSGRRRLFIDCSTDTRRKREREKEPSLHFSSDASERLEIDKRPFHPAR